MDCWSSERKGGGDRVSEELEKWLGTKGGSVNSASSPRIFLRSWVNGWETPRSGGPADPRVTPSISIGRHRRRGREATAKGQVEGTREGVSLGFRWLWSGLTRGWQSNVHGFPLYSRPWTTFRLVSSPHLHLFLSEITPFCSHARMLVRQLPQFVIAAVRDIADCSFG